MKRLMALSVAALVALSALATVAYAGDEAKKEATHATIDEKAPGFTLVDATTGKERSLEDFKGKYVVLEWTNMDCPFVKKHYSGGNMQGLQKKYAEDGVVWLRICSSAPGQQGYFSADVIKDRTKSDKAMQTAYLVDADGTVGRTYGAKTTPHMFVIDKEGVLIYAGGIDDKKSTSPDDIKTSTNYVSQCLDSALSGKPIAVKTSEPYGCSVKYAKKEEEKKTDA